jgi:hypothetical protein
MTGIKPSAVIRGQNPNDSLRCSPVTDFAATNVGNMIQLR